MSAVSGLALTVVQSVGAQPRNQPSSRPERSHFAMSDGQFRENWIGNKFRESMT